MRPRKVPTTLPGEKKPCHRAPMETNLLASLMNLVAHIAVTSFEDGSPRLPGKLFLTTRGTSYEIVAKEPTHALELSVLGSTLDDALALMDLLLGSEEAPWQPDLWAGNRAKPTKHKGVDKGKASS